VSHSASPKIFTPFRLKVSLLPISPILTYRLKFVSFLAYYSLLYHHIQLADGSDRIFIIGKSLNGLKFDVSKLGRLHVIFSRKKTDPRILGLVTDDPKLSASQMIRTYDDRWSIEVFFKDIKQLLGLGQYQNVSYEAAVTHLHLVCFAYALLTHVAISREGAQGKQKSTGKLSTAGLQNEVRRIVWDDLTDYLKQFSSGNQIVKELERLLIAA